MTETLGHHLVSSLRAAASAYVPGDQDAPCAILWPDPEKQWEDVIPAIRKLLPELFVLSDTFAPHKQMGPALWLRCIEARVADGAPPPGTTPVFYLPGVSLANLKASEECPPLFQPLVELQYRGAVWANNGKEWSPHSFLSVKQGGLGLDVRRNQDTTAALAGALPLLLTEPLSLLQGRPLDSDFFNALTAPDATGQVLRWLSNPQAAKEQFSTSQWKAFCQQCEHDFKFDPLKDGPTRAIELLARRSHPWNQVWQRFCESPNSYPGVVDWLRKAAPKSPSLFDTAELWPNINDQEEQKLQQALLSLANRQQNDATLQLAELENQHAARRSYVWQKLKLSPFATALEPLAKLAGLCKTAPGAPTPEKYAEFYAAEGWRVDAAALETMAACESLEQQSTVSAVLRAVYLPWLEDTARHLQQLIRDHGSAVSKRTKPIKPAPGRLVLFADGLRMDVAQQLAEKLSLAGIETKQEWDWSTIPSITGIAKPAASPIAEMIQGGAPGDEFRTRLISTGQNLTADRFANALSSAGWQQLGQSETGDPAGSAWTEAGTLDKRGHTEGWKLARFVGAEIGDLLNRISALLKAGWTEITVVTDHGWLLMPGGLPKVELKAFLTEQQWGRCAALKDGAKTDAQTFKWHWDPNVAIASPPGVACYRLGVEYSHGGISLQEMVTPILRISAAKPGGGSPHLAEAKWTAAKCVVQVAGQNAGLRVDVRTRHGDPSTSLLSDQQARELKPDGKITVFLDDDSNIGKDAHIVLLDANGHVIHSMPTTLGK